MRPTTVIRLASVLNDYGIRDSILGIKVDIQGIVVDAKPAPHAQLIAQVIAKRVCIRWAEQLHDLSPRHAFVFQQRRQVMRHLATWIILIHVIPVPMPERLVKGEIVERIVEERVQQEANIDDIYESDSRKRKASNLDDFVGKEGLHT
ncbi:MAG TPA: hypothetical protein VGD58_01330 [Herpetosiphonaceae bacterium]